MEAFLTWLGKQIVAEGGVWAAVSVGLAALIIYQDITHRRERKSWADLSEQRWKENQALHSGFNEATARIQDSRVNESRAAIEAIKTNTTTMQSLLDVLRTRAS